MFALTAPLVRKHKHGCCYLCLPLSGSFFSLWQVQSSSTCCISLKYLNTFACLRMYKSRLFFLSKESTPTRVSNFTNIFAFTYKKKCEHCIRRTALVKQYVYVLRIQYFSQQTIVACCIGVHRAQSLRSSGIDSKESILPAYVAWRASTSNRVVVPARLTGNLFLDSLKGLQIRALLLMYMPKLKLFGEMFAMFIYTRKRKSAIRNVCCTSE